MIRKPNNSDKIKRAKIHAYRRKRQLEEELDFATDESEDEDTKPVQKKSRFARSQKKINVNGPY